MLNAGSSTEAQRRRGAEAGLRYIRSRETSCSPVSFVVNSAPSMTDDPRTDADVVAAVLAGDVDALETLVERYERRVFALIYRMTGSALWPGFTAKIPAPVPGVNSVQPAGS